MDIFHLKNDPRTAKKTSLLRYTPPILLFTTLISIVTFALSIVLGYQMSQLTPEPYEHSPTTAQIIFYSTTTPILSLLHSIVSFSLPQQFHSLTSLTTSTLVLLGWIIQFSFWTTIDILDGTSLEFAKDWPTRSPQPLQYLRFSFALLGLVGYVGLVGVVGSSALGERRNRGGLIGREDGGRHRKSGEFGLE